MRSCATRKAAPRPTGGRSDGRQPGSRNGFAVLRSRSGRFAALRGAGPVRPPSVDAPKAAMGAADPAKDLTMTSDRDDRDFEPVHTASPTEHILTELQLYGWRPFADAPDPTPLPDVNAVVRA